METIKLPIQIRNWKSCVLEIGAKFRDDSINAKIKTTSGVLLLDAAKKIEKYKNQSVLCLKQNTYAEQIITVLEKAGLLTGYYMEEDYICCALSAKECTVMETCDSNVVYAAL